MWILGSTTNSEEIILFIPWKQVLKISDANFTIIRCCLQDNFISVNVCREL